MKWKMEYCISGKKRPKHTYEVNLQCCTHLDDLFVKHQLQDDFFVEVDYFQTETGVPYHLDQKSIQQNFQAQSPLAR